MTSSRARLWQQLTKLSPLCSGSLHEQYLTCGKSTCSCHDKQKPKLHGPYYLWVRRIGGKQVNRTLKPGPELDRVREGIANYRKMQALMGDLLTQEEALVLEGERASVGEGKKNFKRRFHRR
jgi:uncharacterized protein DUF6788